MQQSKVRTVLGLILVYLAVLLNWQWIWGILFLIWVIPDVFSGITYFMEPIEKKSNPILYWAIIISWLWMSIYMIATPFFPSLNGQSSSGFQPTKELGVYQDQPVKTFHKSPPVSTVKKEKIKGKKTSSSNEKINQQERKKENIVASKDTLAYKSYHQKETHFYVGISADMNVNDPDLEKHTTELWDYFYKNDISQVIPNIVDERVYFIYSPTDKAGNYKATIGYRTKDIKNIYEGLEGVQISPTKFAIFEQTGGDTEKFIATTWEKIYASDLNSSTSSNMEVYELDANYKVKKSEIRVAIQ